MRILFALILLYSSMFGQLIMSGKKGVLNHEDKTSAIYTLNENAIDSLLWYVTRNDVGNVQLTTTGDIALPDTNDVLTASQKDFTSGWTISGDIDTVLNSDSSVTLSNVPVELNPNPTFSDWSYVETMPNDFSSSAGWVLETGWSIANGVASYDGTGTEGNTLYNTSGTTISGDVCRVQVKVNSLSSGFWAYKNGFGGVTSPMQSAIGVSTFVSAATSGVWLLRQYTDGGTAEFDYFSVSKLVGPDGWNASTMDENNYVIQDDEGMRLVSDGTNVYLTIYNFFEVGKTYSYECIVPETSGAGIVFGVNGFFENQIQADSIGTYEGEFTALGTTALIKRNGAATNTVLSYLSFKEIQTNNSISLPKTLEENRYHKLSVSISEGETNTALNPTLDDNALYISMTGTGGAVVPETHETTNPITGAGSVRYDLTTIGSSRTSSYLNVYSNLSNLANKDMVLAFDYQLLSGATNVYGYYTGSSIVKIEDTLESSGTIQFDFNRTGSGNALPVYFDATQLYSILIDNVRMYEREDESQKIETAKLIYQFGSQIDSTDAVSATETEYTFDVLGHGDNEDDYYYFHPDLDSRVTISDITLSGDFEVYWTADNDNTLYQMISSGATATDYLYQSKTTFVIRANNVTTNMTGDALMSGNKMRFKLTRVGSALTLYQNDSLMQTGTNSEPLDLKYFLRRYDGTYEWTGNVYSIMIIDVADTVLNLNGNSGNVTASTWYDASGNGNNGTVLGATAELFPRFKYWLSDTASVKLKLNSLSETNKRVLSFGDSLHQTFVPNTANTGTFQGSVFGNNKESVIDFEVIPSSNILSSPYNLLATANSSGLYVSMLDSNAIDTTYLSQYDFEDDNDILTWSEPTRGTFEIANTTARLTDTSSSSAWISSYKDYTVDADFLRIKMTGKIGTADSWWLVVQDLSTSALYVNKAVYSDSSLTYTLTPISGNLRIYFQINTSADGQYSELDLFSVEQTEASYDYVSLEKRELYLDEPLEAWSELTQITDGLIYTHTGLSDGDQFEYRARFVKGAEYSDYSNSDNDIWNTPETPTSSYALYYDPYADSATIFVDLASGSDSDAGTRAEPYKSIAYAISQASGGDVIELLGSNETTSRIDITKSGTSDLPIILRTEQGEQTTINNPSSYAIQLDGNDHWVFAGFYINNEYFVDLGNTVGVKVINNIMKHPLN